MNEQNDTSVVEWYLNDCSTRLGMACPERLHEVQYTLKSYLIAGTNARANNDLVKAERLYHETIKLAVREFEKVTPEVALARFFLSGLYLDQSELVAAKIFALSALEVSTELFGADHPATYMANNQLVEVGIAFDKAAAASIR